ncbi:S8 family serine peptidase [Bacillus mycoides]|uniref:S8 family peptidase n=1 Tax=Bacillus TaxID=1386 RepID=UPI0021ACD626|nr:MULTISPECIES: S8 family serine peptidase [Bacillus]MDI6533133.1 S8 family serine peptidase [Bacillus mycoides]WJE58142.1 S8 family serine peptidase [Bacillus mycoides]WJE64049.1 S8 family serine peptidase [Bacillus mycoides]WJE76434.1 S8 family serine peptidase [Bacillus mycoides]
MKRYWYISLLLICFLAVNQQTADAAESEAFLLEEGVNVQSYAEQLKEVYPELTIKTIDEIQFVQVEGNTKQLDMAAKLLTNNAIASGDLAGIVSETSNVPNNIIVGENFAKFNWPYARITNNQMKFNQFKGESSVEIALIDSGLDTTHPLFQYNVKPGKTFVESSSSTSDDFGHGTQVAGVVRTIAPQATLVPYKVLGKQGGESIWTLKAMVEAVNDGVDILNISLGTYKSDNIEDEKVTRLAYERAVEYAKKHKVVVVASSGNEGHDLDEQVAAGNYHLPGGLPEVLTVGSTTKDGDRAYYSNYGSNVDIVAPGGDFGPMYSTKGEMNVTYMLMTTAPMKQQQNFIDQAVGLPQGYTLSFGTSLSAPQVSATLALMMAQDKAKKPNPNKYINQLLKEAMDLGKPGFDPVYGYGELKIPSSLK